MAIKVAIIDDHGIIRAGIKSVLARYAEYEICAEGANGEEALEIVEKLDRFSVCQRSIKDGKRKAIFKKCYNQD